MRLIKSLFNSAFSKASKSVEADTDHYQSLEALRAQHEWIEVKFIRTGQRYQSLILNIDMDNGELLIDELYPPENLNTIEAGDRVEISSQSRVKPVNFFTRILSRQFNAGEGSWLLELPDEIGRNINRSTFRIYVENEQQLDIEMYTPDGEALPRVRVINLSAEGIKLAFSLESEPQLNKQHFFEHCLLRLPTGVDIDCAIDLRSVYSIHTPKPHILGGGKLIIGNPQHAVKLQQYLAAIQRRQRRGESHGGLI